MRHVPPSTRETAFNCPHCGALTSQKWHSMRAVAQPDPSPLPKVVDSAHLEVVKSTDFGDPHLTAEAVGHAERLVNGWPILVKQDVRQHISASLENVFVAHCYNCRNVSIWVHEKLVFPARGDAPPANADLPEDIRRDYDEASSILDLSPRGAAALLRLAIQKLCKELGESGKDLNKDIGALVAKGLDDQVRKALDAVRVIGNNAVHPGEMDLQDDRGIAETLFMLLNLIAEKTLTENRKIEEVYTKLPEGALKGIQRRDSGS